MYVCAVCRKRKSAVNKQLVAAATQTGDGDIHLYRTRVGVADMIYQFLARTINLKNSNIFKEFEVNGILLPAETKTIEKQKTYHLKVNSLMIMLRKKSAADFRRFLEMLCAAGQQVEAGVVSEALKTFWHVEQNPLQDAMVRYDCLPEYTIHKVENRKCQCC